MAQLPDDPVTLLRIGRELLAARRFAAAADIYQRLCSLAPASLEARVNHASALLTLERHAEAEACSRDALALRPGFEPALTNLSAALSGQRRHAEAEAAARAATVADPRRPEPWTNLGRALHAQGRLGDAADAFGHASSVAPGYAMAPYNLAQVRLDQWRVSEALAELRRAVALDPGYGPAWHALLFNSLYDPAVTEQALFELHRRWAQTLAPRAATPGSRLATPTHGTRIRVGYVSPDFRRHSCAYFLRPLFTGHDRRAVELFAYSATRQPDDVTDWFRANSDHWRTLAGLPEAAAVDLIRADRIDVLVDLAGHTADQPLGVFALGAAPVQVAWLGYPATSGLAAIGFRITDPVADPPGDADAWHSERLMRLPGGFHCYQAPDDAPGVSPPPALQSGRVRFGSFNAIAKINAGVVAAWASVLAAVPGSTLLVKGRTLAHVEARERLTAAFAAAGVAPGRIELRPWSPGVNESLAAYSEVDVALDTFPFNGATTSFEALWMGVPVVTLRGRTHAGRVGASILTQLGRPAWIAGDLAGYARIARDLAADPAALGRERAGLRAAMLRAGLTDARGFAARMEEAFRDMLARAGHDALY